MCSNVLAYGKTTLEAWFSSILSSQAVLGLSNNWFREISESRCCSMERHQVRLPRVRKKGWGTLRFIIVDCMASLGQSMTFSTFSFFRAIFVPKILKQKEDTADCFMSCKNIFILFTKP